MFDEERGSVAFSYDPSKARLKNIRLRDKEIQEQMMSPKSGSKRKSSMASRKADMWNMRSLAHFDSHRPSATTESQIAKMHRPNLSKSCKRALSMPRGSAAARLRGVTNSGAANVDAGVATITDMKSNFFLNEQRKRSLTKAGTSYGGSKSSTGLYSSGTRWLAGPSAVNIKRKLNAMN